MTLNRLIQPFMDRLNKFLFSLGRDLLGAAVNHAFCHGVHQITPVHKKVIEALASALFVLPIRLCPLVIFKGTWIVTASCCKCRFYPGKTVCAVLALKVLQNLK